MFTWQTPPLDIQSKEMVYDSASAQWKLTLTTTEARPFTVGDLANTILTLDGQTQKTESVTAT